MVGFSKICFPLKTSKFISERDPASVTENSRDSQSQLINARQCSVTLLGFALIIGKSELNKKLFAKRVFKKSEMRSNFTR